MKRSLPYSTPESYFEQLESRLSTIPANSVARNNVRSGRRSGRNLWQVMAPYMALACSFLAAVIIGNAILSKTVSVTGDSTSEEDIINYFIESGTTLAQLEISGASFGIQDNAE